MAIERTAKPNGWLLCAGQAVSRTTYAALFAVIDVIYGEGDNVTTFNLPDLRGRVTAGRDDMGGNNAWRLTGVTVEGVYNGTLLGATGGEEAHSLAQAESPRLYGNSQLMGGGSEYAAIGFEIPGNLHNNVQPTMDLEQDHQDLASDIDGRRV